MDMETARLAALAHYEGLAEEQKKMARRLFEAMDMDKSGNVSIDEFIPFLGLVGLQSDSHYWLFAQLDKDNNGTLDFEELVTFLYILKHDEYKNLLNSQPKADVPGWKDIFRRRRKQKANNQGQRPHWKENINQVASWIQIGQFLNQAGCSIV